MSETGEASRRESHVVYNARKKHLLTLGARFPCVETDDTNRTRDERVVRVQGPGGKPMHPSVAASSEVQVYVNAGDELILERNAGVRETNHAHNHQDHDVYHDQIGEVPVVRSQFDIDIHSTSRRGETGVFSAPAMTISSCVVKQGPF